MSFHGGSESRHPSYAELDGVQVKISEKFKMMDTSFLQQIELACMTLKDLNKLDQFEYSFEIEHLVLQDMDLTLRRQSSAK